LKNYHELRTLYENFRQTQRLDREPLELYEPVDYIMELFHNFSLVHDDIMDAAPLRRGKPTVHARWNVNTGILSGDVMLIHCYEYLLRAPAEATKARLIGIFNQVAIEVCEGQQLDMNFECRDDVSIPEYLDMIGKKTAALIAGSLEMGAVVAGANDADASRLARFGRDIGIAFQLQDDLLDAFGDPGKVGKKVGGDIAQNKKTYLILKALELADAPIARTLKEYYRAGVDGQESEKIAEVIAIFRRLGIPELAEAEKQRFQHSAWAHFDTLRAGENAKAPLRALAESLIGRES
jgi:geranylgeranyl diphosphate synthase type II